MNGVAQRVATAWRLVLWGAAWLTAGIVLWVTARGTDWAAAFAAARNASVWLLGVAVLANLAILLLWASLWRLVLPRDVHVTYPRMLEIATVTSAIMNTIPALVGHASAVALLVRRGNMPVRSAAAVITLDQVGEGLSKLAVLAAALWLVELPAWMERGAIIVGLAVIALVTVVFSVILVAGGASGDGRTSRLLNAIRTDLHAIRSPARAVAAVGVALAMKGAEAGAIAGVMLALGLDVPPGAAFVVLGAVNLATMLPVAPGNVGTYEAGAVAAYRWLGVAPEAALAAALVQHVCFLLPAVGAGVAALAIGGAEIARLPLSAVPSDRR